MKRDNEGIKPSQGDLKNDQSIHRNYKKKILIVVTVLLILGASVVVYPIVRDNISDLVKRLKEKSYSTASQVVTNFDVGEISKSIDDGSEGKKIGLAIPGAINVDDNGATGIFIKNNGDDPINPEILIDDNGSITTIFKSKESIEHDSTLLIDLNIKDFSNSTYLYVTPGKSENSNINMTYKISIVR